MPLVISSPYKEIAVGNGNKRSYWNAAHSPIVFNCVRQDAQVFSVVDSANAGEFFINLSSAVTSTIGQTVYLKTTNGKYSGSYVILDIVGVSILVSGTFNGNGSGYLNYYDRTNYRTEFRLYITVAGTTYTEYLTRTPAPDGTFSVDFSSVCKQYLSLKNERDYSATPVNAADDNLSGYFNGSYREIYGSTISNYSLLGTGASFFFTNAAKQFKDQYGSNLLNYVPLIGTVSLASTEPDVSNNALFLSYFTKPIYWEGWPFDLSFIYSEYLNGQQVQKVELFLDQNGNSVGAGSSFAALDINGLEAVNQLKLIGTYSTAVRELGVYLRIDNSGDDALTTNALPTSTGLTTTNGSSVTIKPVSANYVSTNYVLSGYVQAFNAVANDLRITEIKSIEVRQCTEQNPFYLCWLNALGGYEYWMFEVNQIDDISVSNVTEYSKYFDDLEVSERELFDLENSKIQSYTLGAENIPLSQLIGLKQLVSSPCVYKLEQDGTRTRLRVKPASYSLLETRDGFGSIELDVIMPELQLQTA